MYVSTNGDLNYIYFISSVPIRTNDHHEYMCVCVYQCCSWLHGLRTNGAHDCIYLSTNSVHDYMYLSANGTHDYMCLSINGPHDYLYISTNGFHIIVLAHWNNSSRVVLSLHSDTLFWFRNHQFFLVLLNYVCLVERQQISIS